MLRLLRPGPFMIPVLLLLLSWFFLFPLKGPALWALPAGTDPGGNGAKVFMSEDFKNLEGWVPYRLFSKGKETLYTPDVEDGEPCLKAQSDSSASALVYKKEFDVYEFPVVKWKWMVANLYPKGDIKKKSGNDSPARLYILFKYNPKKAGFFTKLKYSMAKMKFGMYPPESSLCYIWANHPHKERVLTSPTWKYSKNIVLEGGPGKLNEWREEKVNILDDYRAAFGIAPPHTAAIAIMNDSDDTKGKSTSWFGPIEISGPVRTSNN